MPTPPQAPPKLELLELREGKSLWEIVVQIYALSPNLEQVAHDLSITRVTLWYWMGIRGFSVKDVRAEVARRSMATPLPVAAGDPVEVPA